MPDRGRALIFLAAGALAIAVPARAQLADPDPKVVTAIASAQEAAGREDCPGVLGALDPVVPGLEPGGERSFVQRMRLICLGPAGRIAELAVVQGELANALPRDGVVRAFGALIAADQDRFTDAAEQIALIADSAPQALDVVTGSTVRTISRRLAQDDAGDARSRMLIALARADWEPADIPELRVGFAEEAIGALVDQGQSDEAEGLLERIDQPELLSAMAVDRHYSPLWPAIEARMGPGGGTAVDRFARDKLALFGDSPESDVNLRNASNAMLLLGRYQDVIDLTDRVQVAEGMNSDRVRTVLLRARALASLQRNDDVDHLLGSFLTLDLRKVPAASSALVSYAEFLDEIGRPARALDVVRDTRARAGDLITDLGHRWLDRTEVCTLSALGRADEANSAIGKLKPLAAQNHAAVIEALLCARRQTEASKLTLDAFENRESAGDLLLQFQPSGSLWAPAPSRLRALWAVFLARPEIKAAFERRGRILPRTYWPDTRPRAIPRRPSNGATLA